MQHFFTKKIHLNKTLNIIKEFGRTLLVLFESPQWLGFNEGGLEIFVFKVQEILNFEYFLSFEIQLNFKNGFERKN
jgi:hypothetical protein